MGPCLLSPHPPVVARSLRSHLEALGQVLECTQPAPTRDQLLSPLWLLPILLIRSEMSPPWKALLTTCLSQVSWGSQPHAPFVSFMTQALFGAGLLHCLHQTPDGELHGGRASTMASGMVSAIFPLHSPESSTCTGLPSVATVCGPEHSSFFITKKKKKRFSMYTHHT